MTDTGKHAIDLSGEFCLLLKTATNRHKQHAGGGSLRLFHVQSRSGPFAVFRGIHLNPFAYH